MIRKEGGCLQYCWWGVLASILLFAGCKSTEKGGINLDYKWRRSFFQEARGGFCGQAGAVWCVSAEKKRTAKFKAISKSKVTIDEETGLWNECDDETMYAKI